MDFGHAICYANSQYPNYGHLSYFKIMIDTLKPTMYHLSDGFNLSTIDNHLHFGDGSYNIEEILSLVPGERRITIETPHDFDDDLCDFEKDCLYGEERFRFADIKDAKLLFDWRNDKEVVNNSFSGYVDDYVDHEKWVEDKIKDKNVLLFIYEKGSVPIGMIKLEKDSCGIKISYSVDKKYRGLGYGTKIIDIVEKYSKSIGSKFYAEVKKDNIASQKIFEKAGYEKFKYKSYITYKKEFK